jgi:acyl carrier protein
VTVEARLRQVFADVFGVDPTSVTDDTSPESIPTWDSVKHLSLVFALEDEFQIQFATEEIPGFVSFGAIYARVAQGEQGRQ